jgi:hypothetical protein
MLPMNKKSFSALLFLLLSVGAFGQEGLLIKNIKNGKAWMYEKNATVTYIRFHEQEYTTGILNALLDSAVVFGKDTVRLKDIAGIRKKNPLHNVARIVGMPLMFIGSLFMGQGAANMYTEPKSDSGIKLFLTGAAVFALGYLPYGLSLEDLTVGFGGEWTLEIYRGTSPK